MLYITVLYFVTCRCVLVLRRTHVFVCVLWLCYLVAILVVLARAALQMTGIANVRRATWLENQT
jgi:hypothetical protein